MPYPSQTRPVEMHRRHAGRPSSHLTLRVLGVAHEYWCVLLGLGKQPRWTHLQVRQPDLTLVLVVRWLLRGFMLTDTDISSVRSEDSLVAVDVNGGVDLLCALSHGFAGSEKQPSHWSNSLGLTDAKLPSRGSRSRETSLHLTLFVYSETPHRDWLVFSINFIQRPVLVSE